MESKSNDLTPLFSRQYALMNNVRPYLSLKDLSRLVRTCRTAKNIFQESLLSAKVDKLLIPLLESVARGDKQTAESIIRLDPTLLLKKAPKPIKDYCGREIDGFALQIALGAEDVNIRRCGLVLQDADSKGLYVEQYVLKTLYIRVRDALYYVDRDNTKVVKIELDQKALQLLDKELNPTRKLKILSIQELKKITEITGHIHEMQMAEMIIRHLKKLPHGIDIIEKQISEQFPPDWRKKEEERRNNDSRALQEVIAAIIASKEDADCEEALQRFYDYLKPKAIIKTGKHFNIQILIEALHIYSRYIFNDRRKDSLFVNKVILHIQRYLPACYAQLCKQGISDHSNYSDDFMRITSDTLLSPFDTDFESPLGQEDALISESNKIWAVPQQARFLLRSLETITGIKQQSYAEIQIEKNDDLQECNIM